MSAAESPELIRLAAAWANGEPLPDPGEVQLGTAGAAAEVDRLVSDNADLPSLSGKAGL